MSDLVLGILIGVPAGVALMYLVLKIAINVAINKIKEDLGSLDEMLEQHQENVIDCRVESHQGMFFVYNNDTNEFMAQGSTLAELRERIRARWSNRRVSVVAGDETVLEQLKAQLNESSSSQ